MWARQPAVKRDGTKEEKRDKQGCFINRCAESPKARRPKGKTLEEEVEKADNDARIHSSYAVETK